MHHDLFVIFDGPDESTYFSHFETILGVAHPKFVSNLLDAHIYLDSSDARKALVKIREFYIYENAFLGHFARNLNSGYCDI